MNNRRILWIDSVKGIAILLLLFSHSMTTYDLVKNWILAFRIPIFFIICGYIVHLKYSDGFKQGQFLNLLSKRWYNLFLPYFLFGIIWILFLNVLRFLGSEPLRFHPLIVNLISMEGVASLWFLPTYFFSEILLITILGLFRGVVRYGVIALIILILSLTDQSTMSYPFSLIYRVVAGSVFVFMGFIFASYKIEDKLSWKTALLLFLLFSYLTVFNKGASMNDMKIVPLYLLNATIINLSFISLVRFLGEKWGNNNYLTFYGKNSLIVICTNNVIIEVIRLIDYILFGNILLSMGYLGIFIFFIIITICEYPILKIFEGKFNRDYFQRKKGVMSNT